MKLISYPLRCWSIRSRLRVIDLEAATAIVIQSIEAVIHDAVIFDSEIEAKRLLDALADMTARYLFDESVPRQSRGISHWIKAFAEIAFPLPLITNSSVLLG